MMIDCTLKDVATSIQTGPFGSQLHSSDYSEEGTPVVMPQDIVDGQISESKIARVDDSQVERLARHKLKQGEIVYPRRGDLAKCAFVTPNEENWLCGTGCLKVTIDTSKANPKYIYFYLQLPDSVSCIENATIGSTMPNLNTGILGNVRLKLPNIDIQNKIVDILSQYDELIAINRKKIQVLEEMAMRTYREWFVHMRFPGYETTPKEDGLPQGWNYESLAELGSFKRGVNITKDVAIEGEIPVVAGGLSPSCYHNVANTLAPVITVSASGANAGFTRLYFQNIWAADCSYLDSNCPHIFYIYCFMKTYKEGIDNLQKGSAQPHVYANLDKISEL